MPGGESEQHLALKRGAALWAQAHGYRYVAPEISLPKSRYRADLAGYRPDRPGAGTLGIGQTAVFECKQSRADFLKDSRSVAPTIDRLEALSERRKRLEEMLGVHHPHLRLGESLFPEFDAYRFDHLPHKGYREVMREIRILQKRLYEKTKFERLIRWRCANAFYLVVTPGILSEHEVPEGWGLLVQDERSELDLARRPGLIKCDDGTRLELLQRIAAYGTRELNQKLGVDFEEVRDASRTSLWIDGARGEFPIIAQSEKESG